MKNFSVLIVLSFCFTFLNASPGSSASSQQLATGCGEAIPTAPAVYRKTLNCNSQGICLLSNGGSVIHEAFGQCYVLCVTADGHPCHASGLYKKIFFKTNPQVFESQLVPWLE